MRFSRKVIGIFFLLPLLSISTIMVYGEEIIFSDKVHHLTNEWIDENIDDAMFVKSIVYYLENGEMVIPDLIINDSENGYVIPDWFKNNAGWWAEGAITDDSFAKGIKFLAQKGILPIYLEEGFEPFKIPKPIQIPKESVTASFEDTKDIQKKLVEDEQKKIQNTVNSIKQDFNNRIYGIFSKIPDQDEVLDYMGKDKSSKYKAFFEGLQSRNIQAENFESLLSSDKITLEERKIISDYFEDILRVMKVIFKDMNNELDKIVELFIIEINEKDLPEKEKAQVIKDIQLDADIKKNQMINVFAEIMEPLESSLEKEKSKQVIIEEITDKSIISDRGGCLIATATFGSELAPQVQQLRELRDSKLLQTQSGSAFMKGFNQFYYSFSPIIADYERENPVFRETVKLAITPMISSLSILNYVDMDSEIDVLVYGTSLILLNVGMYFVVPAIVIVRLVKENKSPLS